jgi:glycosyltransferase involved in cell wall biosynthesis
MSEVAVVVSTYNEVDNVRPLIARLRALPLSPGIVVVDDNSPDGTAAVVAEIARADPRVDLVRRPAKLGLGTAHKAGIARARSLGARLVAIMDADLSHPPERLPALVEAAERTQGIAIGSRYVRGGSSDYGSDRQFLSKTANLLAWIAIGGAPVRDATAGFRCFSRRALEALDWDEIRSDGYSFQVEVVAAARARRIPIVEVPIHFRDRVAGVSKISRREVVKGVVTLARLLHGRLVVRRRRSRKDSCSPGASAADLPPRGASGAAGFATRESPPLV